MTHWRGRIVPASVLALIVLAFSTLSVGAAKKVIDVKTVNLSIPIADVFDPLPDEICGVSGPFGGFLVLNVLRFTLWDNGHFTFHTSNSVRLTDGAGNPVLKDQIAVHEVQGKTSLPANFGVSLNSHCHGTTPTPGKTYKTHITITIGKDGNVKQIHGDFCDPVAYPFC